jgi:hypothetical protein
MNTPSYVPDMRVVEGVRDGSKYPSETFRSTSYPDLYISKPKNATQAFGVAIYAIPVPPIPPHLRDDRYDV